MLQNVYFVAFVLSWNLNILRRIVVPCYHPLKGFPIGITKTGKVDYKITGYGVDHVELVRGIWTPVHIKERGSMAQRVVRESIEIPCGQCIGCRMQYSREWANRCLLELEDHDSAWFATLTYDNDHVPRSCYGDPETGEVIPSLSLRKRDLQLFMKRLRKAFPDDRIRFYAAGEYGSHTFRPHYHVILFGLHLDDLQIYERDPETGFVLYLSPSLQACWSVKGDDGVKKPIGRAVVSEVSWETCAYTARYVTKKLTGPAACFYDDHNIEPPFTQMSLKPGIGRNYYDNHSDLYKYEYINVSTAKGGRKFRPPKYFDRIFDVEYPDESAAMKEARKRIAMDARQAKLAQTNLSYIDLLAVEERALKERIKSLKRRLD